MRAGAVAITIGGAIMVLIGLGGVVQSFRLGLNAGIIVVFLLPSLAFIVGGVYIFGIAKRRFDADKTGWDSTS